MANGITTLPRTAQPASAGEPYSPAAAPRVVVVLPAYNEQDALPQLLDSIQAALEPPGMDYRVIVVDDGSRDNTASVAREAARRLPVDLVPHQANQGLAAAIRTGLTTAAQSCQGGDVIVTMDCDNTHPPRLIPRMVAMIADGNDVVIASRFQPGAQIVGVPMSRQLYSIGARWLFQLLFPIRGVRDYTCGFRAYRAETVRQAFARYGDSLISEAGFSCMADLLLKLRTLPVEMAEVPFELRYDRRGGGSKMRVLRTIRQTLSLLFRRRLGLR